MIFIAFKRLFWLWLAAQSAAAYAWDNNHNGLWDELEAFHVGDTLEMNWVESAQERFRDLALSREIDQTLVAGLNCDRLAEHPSDPKKRFDGVVWEKLQSKEAIAVCQLAVQTFPSASKWQYQLGRVLFADMQCDRAYQHFLQALILNDPRGAYGLGIMYQEDKHSCGHNDQQAVYWYQKAAEQGNVVAQFNLGVMYDEGSGVPQDGKQAVYWYQKAAEQGYLGAQYNLGLMYENGRGVPKDDKQAVYWFQKAAEQGYAGAQYNLGLMYAEGRGVPQDDKQAVSWFQKVAEQGYAGAQYNLGVMYENGRGVPQDDKQAVSWFQKSAEQGDADAQYILGYMYAEGRGVPQDDKQAVSWFQKAAEQGFAKAQNILRAVKFSDCR